MCKLFFLLLYQLAHATCMSWWRAAVTIENSGISLKTATCLNRSNSIYLQFMYLPPIGKPPHIEENPVVTGLSNTHPREGP